jgi:hypothetical protein
MLDKKSYHIDIGTKNAGGEAFVPKVPTTDVEKQIALAVENQSRQLWTFTVFIFVGIVVTCLTIIVLGFNSGLLGPLGTLSISAAYPLARLYHKSRTKTLAKCPQCGFDWEITPGNRGMNTPKCEKCPGCGLSMQT